MTVHIGAQPGQIAETVLMPGDPLRAEWAANTFLDNPVCVNRVRGMLGFTGTWQGHPVTIHGSGMGMPSLSIYANELIREYGAKTLIRIGSAGAMQDKVKLRDVILAMTASSLSTPTPSIRSTCSASSPVSTAPGPPAFTTDSPAVRRRRAGSCGGRGRERVPFPAVRSTGGSGWEHGGSDWTTGSRAEEIRQSGERAPVGPRRDP